MMLRWIALVCLLLTSTFAQIPAQQGIRVGPGDAVRLYVYDGLYQVENDRFISTFHDQEFIVDGFGQIHLTSIGRVMINNLNAEEISKLLQEKFKPFAKDPRVIVVPLIRLSFRGGFGKPGLYRFDLNMSAWEMLEQVGGVTGLSRLEEIYIMRQEEIIYSDFYEAFYDASSLYELGLQSGDEVLAPRVNRLTFDTVMRYVQFGMSMLIFYFTMLNYRRN
ncbi:hypothetical protein GF406_07745 [candidate division KSB1 bacterium]|nr:hypothetical protein [candidate division KSB1 bacterium]